MPKHCDRCRATGRHLHHTVDEIGSTRICGMCVLALLAELDRAGLTLTLMLEQPPAVRSA